MKKHLTLSERALIEKCIAQDMTFVSIARTLERSPSTISREFPAFAIAFAIPDLPTPVWIAVNSVLTLTAAQSAKSMSRHTASF